MTLFLNVNEHMKIEDIRYWGTEKPYFIHEVPPHDVKVRYASSGRQNGPCDV
jgi:hypothetical protein